MFELHRHANDGEMHFEFQDSGLMTLEKFECGTLDT